MASLKRNPVEKFALLDVRRMFAVVLLSGFIRLALFRQYENSRAINHSQTLKQIEPVQGLFARAADVIMSGDVCYPTSQNFAFGFGDFQFWHLGKGGKHLMSGKKDGGNTV